MPMPILTLFTINVHGHRHLYKSSIRILDLNLSDLPAEWYELKGVQHRTGQNKTEQGKDRTRRSRHEADPHALKVRIISQLVPNSFIRLDLLILHARLG